VSGELWITFLVATLVIVAIPGPTVLLIAGCALARGTGSALSTILGVALADVLVIALALGGAGALMARAPTLFAAMKLLGAAYLLYLGLALLRARPAEPERAWSGPARRRARSLVDAGLQGFLVTLLNPKTFVFVLAFFPQFVDPARPAAPQLLLLGASFLALALPVATVYAVLGGQARQRLMDPRWGVVLSRAGGALLIAASLLMVSGAVAG